MAKKRVTSRQPAPKKNAPAGQDLQRPKTKREIIAAKLGFEADELLAYVEKPNGLIIAIAPDGRKFKYEGHAIACPDNKR